METYIAIIELQITYDAENMVAPHAQGPGYVSGVATVDIFVIVGHGVLLYGIKAKLWRGNATNLESRMAKRRSAYLEARYWRREYIFSPYNDIERKFGMIRGRTMGLCF
jgi:hypothetical protein